MQASLMQNNILKPKILFLYWIYNIPKNFVFSKMVLTKKWSV